MIAYNEIAEPMTEAVAYLVPQEVIDQQRGDLEDAKTQWKELDMRDYTCTCLGYCSPQPIISVRVKDNEVESRLTEDGTVWGILHGMPSRLMKCSITLKAKSAMAGSWKLSTMICGAFPRVCLWIDLMGA